MPDRWFTEYHSGSDENPLSWWEVKTDDRNYFIVENVGDPKDGKRLASMLNERERLLIDKVDMQRALAECQQKLQMIGGDSYDELLARIDELLAR